MPATENDMTACLETFEKERVCSFHIDTELTTPRRPDDNPTTTRRATRGEGPATRPPDYKREPFATHSGRTFFPFQNQLNFLLLLRNEDIVKNWISKLPP